MHLQCCEREKVQPEDPNQPPERPDFSGMDKVANSGKTWFQAQSLQLILEVTMNRAGEPVQEERRRWMQRFGIKLGSKGFVP